jgi:hypothetical protein
MAVPAIAGVIGCSALRDDASLLDAEEYDLATGLVPRSSVAMPTISDCQARRDSEAAAAVLVELLAEFPFAGDASKAVALSMILTPVLCRAMAVAPMHLVTAPQPGSGKSYLADTASMIVAGERFAIVAVAPQSRRNRKAPDRQRTRQLSYNIIGLDNFPETLEATSCAKSPSACYCSFAPWVKATRFASATPSQPLRTATMSPWPMILSAPRYVASSTQMSQTRSAEPSDRSCRPSAIGR